MATCKTGLASCLDHRRGGRVVSLLWTRHTPCNRPAHMKDDDDDRLDHTPELLGVITEILLMVGAMFVLGALRC